MTKSNTPISGLLVFEPRVFEDERGSFFESFNCQKFKETVGEAIEFVQDNESKSTKGVLRGLHYQNPPFAQGKLVRVTSGAALDIAVDIRKHSPTFGEHFSILLSAENKKQLWIPAGFAHGFVALENNTIFFYKCTNYYVPESEGTIKWNDKDLKIDWQVNNPIVSNKDENGTEFCNFVSSFDERIC